MNARDIIKLAAQLYVYDTLKKKITILTNIQKGKYINVDIFLPKVTDVTARDKKQPNRIRCTSVYGLPHRTTPRQKVQ